MRVNKNHHQHSPTCLLHLTTSPNIVAYSKPCDPYLCMSDGTNRVSLSSPPFHPDGGRFQVQRPAEEPKLRADVANLKAFALRFRDLLPADYYPVSFPRSHLPRVVTEEGMARLRHREEAISLTGMHPFLRVSNHRRHGYRSDRP